MKKILEEIVKKNVLLIQPETPKNTYWSFDYALSYINKKVAMPPNGLATVAAMFPEDKYDVIIRDMNVEPLTDSDIRNADLVGFTGMVVHKDSLEHAMTKVNKFNVPTFIGGPYATQYYEQIQGINHHVLGEAESGVLEAFIRDFEKGEAKKVYARVVLRKTKIGKEIDEKEYNRLVDFFKNDSSDIQLVGSRPSMAVSPIPRHDLLKINEYGSMAVQNSRGCGNICDFCTIPHLLGHESRLKKGERLIDEFKLLFDLDYRGALFIVDDQFIGNIKKTKESLVAIQKFQEKHGYPFNLYTEASLNLARDTELMEMMRDAGFNMVFIGIESPDEKVLGAMNKTQNKKRNLVEDIIA